MKLSRHMFDMYDDKFQQIPLPICILYTLILSTSSKILKNQYKKQNLKYFLLF